MIDDAIARYLRRVTWVSNVYHFTTCPGCKQTLDRCAWGGYVRAQNIQRRLEAANE